MTEVVLAGEQEPVVEEPRRRVRIYAIGMRPVLRAFFGEDARNDKYIERPRVTLPEGYKIVGSNYNWMMNCVEVMVEHESFDEVEFGQIPPVATAMVDWECIEVVYPQGK